MDSPLYGHNLYFSNDYILSARMFYLVHEAAAKCSNKMIMLFNDIDTLGDLIDFAQELKNKIYLETIDNIIRRINKKHNIINKDHFKNECDGIWGKFESIFTELIEVYLDSSNDKILAQKYHEHKLTSLELNKNVTSSPEDTAMNIVNTNFANLTIDKVNSILNIDNFSNTKMNINSMMRKILQEKKYIALLADAIHEDIMNVLPALLTAYKKHINFSMCYSKDDYENAENIAVRIEDSLVPEEKLKPYISKMIYLSPFNPKSYSVSYYLLGDENNELENLASVLEVDIDFSKFKAAEEKARAFFGDVYPLIEKQFNHNIFYKQTKGLLGLSLDKLLLQCKYLFSEKLQLKLLSKLEKNNILSFDIINNLFGCYHSKNEVPLLIYDNSVTSDFMDGFILTDKSIYFSTGAIFDIKNIKSLTITPFFIEIDNIKVPIPFLSLNELDLKELQDFFDYFLLLNKYYILNNLNSSNKNKPNNLTDSKGSALYLDEIFNIFHDNELKNYIVFNSKDLYSEKKFYNAIESYACLGPDEIPILCFDNTALGSAKAGCLITTKGIHVHNSYLNPKRFLFCDIYSIEINRIFPHNIYINNYEIQTTSLTSTASKQRFCSLLNKIKMDLTSSDILTPRDTFKNIDLENSTNLVIHIRSILNVYSLNHELQKSLLLYSVDPKVQKKFENAADYYASLDHLELPFLCYDNTVFGSAKEGLLVTSKGIFAHNSFSKPQSFHYRDIYSIYMGGTSDNTLFINNYELQTTMLCSYESKMILCRLLNYICEHIKK